MVNLNEYKGYFDFLVESTVGVNAMFPITFDVDINKYVQSLGPDSLPVLFVVMPTAESTSDNPDNIRESNYGLILLLDKLDIQRKSTFEIQSELQPVFEAIKTKIRSEYGNCGILGKIDLSSMTSVPESGLFAVMSGWSLGFRFESE